MIIMLLTKIFVPLLLVPAALTTPVPGKEMGVLESTSPDALVRRNGPLGSSYRPALDHYCRLIRTDPKYDYALNRGRSCIDNEKFTFLCYRERDGAQLVTTSYCASDYYCVNTSWTSEATVGDDHNGYKNILCKHIDLKLTLAIGPYKTHGQTELSPTPPGPSGHMTGLLTLQGDVGGMRPALDFKYVANDRPGQNLLGEKVIKNGETTKPFQMYSIDYNYDHDAQFFGAVQYLSPKHVNTLTLTLYLTYAFATAVLPGFGGKPPLELESRETSEHGEVAEQESAEMLIEEGS